MKKTLYLFSKGELVRKDNTLCFKTEEGNRFVPVEGIHEIFVMGEITFNKRLLEFLSQHEIILHIFNYHQYYMGTFYPREHLNSGYVTLRQAQVFIDAEERKKLARKFVEGGSKNMLRVLKYYQSRGKEVKEAIEKIEKLLEKVETAETIEVMMAIEGNIREHYYKAFDNILQQEEFTFESRTRRPPKNNLNTLISFGNSLIYTMCLSEIYKTHLDPRIGFLHATNFRRFTLNLDIAEIFKPIIVDRAIFTVVGKGMIKGDDFMRGTEGLMMKEQARKTFVNEIENKLKTTIKHRSIGREISYRRLIRLECYKLEKHLMGEKEYEPFVAQW